MRLDDLPQLVFHEWTSPSGYAPRVIQLSAAHENVLFVGCKDGSVTVVRRVPGVRTAAVKGKPMPGTWHPNVVVTPDRGKAAVRSICEWDAERILVGRNDGSLELVTWKTASPEVVTIETRKREGDAVLLVARLDGNRAILSSRHGGCRVVRRVDGDPVLAPRRLRFGQPNGGRGGRLEPGAIRFVAPLARVLKSGREIERWLFISERGELFSWDGRSRSPVVPASPGWQPGERPAAVNDIGLWRPDDARQELGPARGVFIATDTGVYLVDISDRKGVTDHERLQVCRLSLSGLGAICTALSYTEGEQFRYLWAADLSGDCHLFWDDGAGGDEYVDFRRSGLVHADSQVLVCFAWYGTTSGRREPSRRTLFFGQARRNDRIVISDYTDLAVAPAPVEGTDPAKIRWLLSRGTVAEIERFLQQRRRDVPRGPVQGSTSRKKARADYERWREPPAVLAELFELLANEEPTRRILLESLLGQSAADAILETLVREVAGKRSGSEVRREVAAEVNRVLQTWTLSLLGVIHRHPTARERDSAYLSLLRWVRNRQQALRTVLLDELHWNPGDVGKVEDEVEVSVRFARKWGVYGEANARRDDLVLPLRRLRHDATAAAERLDRLTYQILLYRRQVSLRGLGTETPMRGRTAWSMAPLDLGGGLLVAAVSWTWGGIEVFRVRREGTAPGPAVDLRWEVRPRQAPGDTGDVAAVRPARLEPILLKTAAQRKARTDILRDPYGHSRTVHLGRVGRDAYLLVAPVGGPEDPGPEHVFLGEVAARGGDVELGTLTGTPLPDDLASESIHSLAEIEPGWLVVGFRGSRRAARVGLLEIRRCPDGLETVLHPSIRLEAPAIEASGDAGDGEAVPGQGRSGSGAAGGVSAEEAETNRAWSLAVGDVRKTPGNRHGVTVFVGCERGEVFRLRLERKDGPWTFLGSSGGAQKVASLSSSVRALAYREVPGGSRRLFAGGEDGTLMAWQEVIAPRSSPSGFGARSRFVSLWATAEVGAVTDLHLLPEVELVAEKRSKRHRAVLALTRDGRAVLFDDREEAGELPDKDRPDGRSYPTRIPFPGCRHGRPALRVQCFASVVTRSEAVRVQSPSGPVHELRAPFVPEVELLVASGEGTIRLVGIHDPSYSDSRDERYRHLLEDWWKVVDGGQQLRLGSALYRAAPAMERILVRWLLDPTYPSRTSTEERKPHENPDVYQPTWPELLSAKVSWWLPRHLRPLSDLKTAWEELEAETGDAAEPARRIREALELLLRRAWQYDDLDLFKEICEMVLKRANFLLHDRIARHADREDPHWPTEKGNVRTLYEELFDALGRTVQRWLGAGEGKEARAHMAIVKHLVDGDTVRQLLAEVEREAPRGPDDRILHSAPADGPCTEILHRRIGGVSDLVFKRDPLVNLEAIRAANLSLFRMCRRLSGDSRAAWPHRAEVEWPVFEPYFRHLMAAAGRTFGASIELGDALSHEYGRTFALAIYACPSATIRIANLLTETQLITDPDSEEDFSHRVSWQLQLLKLLGLTLPDEVPILFEAVARPRRGLINPMDQVREELERRGGSAEREVAEGSGTTSRWARFGNQNDYDLRCMERLYDGVVGWFEALQTKLASDAQGINLTAATEDLDEPVKGLNGLEHRCRDFDIEDGQDLYLHSRRFWWDRVRDLKDKLGLIDGAGEARVTGVSKGIRPEVVLARGTLGRWAEESLNDLDRRYQASDIFQPEYRHFREVLLRFERVAKRFHLSAAVHKSIVEGVLGHHLLEDLDEHVLELIEIAHVMDPWMVQAYLDEGRPPTSLDRPASATAEAFAVYLLGRSRNAESIPKNLRTLQSLLVRPQGDEGEVAIQKVIRRALRHGPVDSDAAVGRWILPEDGGFEVARPHARFLELVIRELDQNDRAYGPTERGDGRHRPEVRFEGSPETGVRVSITFHVHPDLCEGGSENAFTRLETLRESGLQEPVPPWSDRSFASHGTGLYLANLAAAVAGWRLQVGEPSPTDRTVTFHVEHLAEADGPGRRSENV